MFQDEENGDGGDDKTEALLFHATSASAYAPAAASTGVGVANLLLASFRLDGKTALVVGDHAEVVKSVAESLASLGAGVAEGNLESAIAGTWAG